MVGRQTWRSTYSRAAIAQIFSVISNDRAELHARTGAAHATDLPGKYHLSIQDLDVGMPAACNACQSRHLVIITTLIKVYYCTLVMQHVQYSEGTGLDDVNVSGGLQGKWYSSRRSPCP